MGYNTFLFLSILLFILGMPFTLYGIYYCVVAVFGFKKEKEYPDTAPNVRFAILVPARNEAHVIGEVIQSLNNQNYPNDMFNVYVAPNNCNDNTMDISIDLGASIFTPKGEIHCKGDILTQFCDMLLESKQYDAFCVFDADNVAHPDFLQQMNNAYHAGVEVAQSSRKAKNPLDSAITTSYAVYYWVVDKLFNGGREALNLSSLVVGSGYMVTVALLEELGGWHTSSLTEDYEFTAQCVLKGRRVFQVPQAITYDELPLTFIQSWKQRRRWTTGFLQNMGAYFGKLLGYSAKSKSMVGLDLALTFVSPAFQFISLIIGTISLAFTIFGIIKFHTLSIFTALIIVTSVLVALFITCCLAAAAIIWKTVDEKRGKATKGILFFAFFLLSWLPISTLSLFRKQKEWEAIAHTRSWEGQNQTKK